MSGKALEGCCELVQEKITDFAASIRAPGGNNCVHFFHIEDHWTMAHISKASCIGVNCVFSIFLTMCRISPPAGAARLGQTGPDTQRLGFATHHFFAAAQLRLAGALQTWLGLSVSLDSTKISEIDTQLSDTRGAAHEGRIWSRYIKC